MNLFPIDDEPLPLAQLATAINQEHQQCQETFRTSLLHALRCGELLLQAKGQCAHGAWLPWLKANTTIAERTAQAYMKVAKKRAVLEVKSAAVADLTLKQALECLQEPAKQDDPLETLESLVQGWRDGGKYWYDQSAPGIMVLDALGKGVREIADVLDRPIAEVQAVLNPTMPRITVGDPEEAKLLATLEGYAWKFVHMGQAQHYSMASNYAGRIGEEEAALYLRSLSRYHQKQSAKDRPDIPLDDQFLGTVYCGLVLSMVRHADGIEFMEEGPLAELLDKKCFRSQMMADLIDAGQLDEWLDHQREGQGRDFALSNGIATEAVDRFYAES